MDVTGFLNDVIVGTAVFLRDFLNTALTFLLDPSEIAPLLAAGAAVPAGLVPPVSFFVLSAVLLVLAGVATISVVAPAQKDWWLTRYLLDGIKGLDGKRLMTVSIPFLALFTLQAACIVLVSDAFGDPVAFRTALALCCYFGGTGYLLTAFLVLAVLPQWALAEERRFRPRWVWGAVLGVIFAVMVSRNGYNFYGLLRDLIDGGIIEAIVVYAASLALSGGIIGLVCLWAKPLIDRSVSDETVSKEE